MQKRERYIRLSAERWRHVVERKGKLRDPLPADHSASARRDGHSELDQYRSRILGRYAPFKPFKNRTQQRQRLFTVPDVFSLTKNPSAALDFYSDLVTYARTAKTPKITLDHRNVKWMGLAADSVLAVLIKEMALESRSRRKTYLRGFKAKNKAVQKMMDEIGCVRVMEDFRKTGERDIKIELKSGAKVFRHQNRKSLKVDALTLDPTSATARDFADHLNSCLRGAGRKLTDAGMQRLLGYVGEILANAQEHSQLAEWTIVGYVDLDGKGTDEGLTYRCTILSFGETFFDTFDRLDRNSYTYQQVAPYLKIHGKFFGKKWREEDLVALLALQGYVSCKQETAAGDRGQGTVDFIEFFQNVCKECAGLDSKPEMSVLTGRTLFKFDGTYKMELNAAENRMTIAFNERKSLLEPPDSQAVVALDKGFPGVVISISIPITPAVLEVVHGKDDEN